MSRTMYYSSSYNEDGLVSMYDWVSSGEHNQRTPERYPYSFSEYFVWRNVSKSDMIKDIQKVYSDRMSQWDYEKAQKAFLGKSFFGELSEIECDRIVKEYFGDDSICVAYALGCNHSNGYPIGIFYIKKK